MNFRNIQVLMQQHIYLMLLESVLLWCPPDRHVMIQMLFFCHYFVHT